MFLRKIWNCCLTISICKNNVWAFPTQLQCNSLQITSSSCFLDQLPNLKGNGDTFYRECSRTVHFNSQRWLPLKQNFK